MKFFVVLATLMSIIQTNAFGLTQRCGGGEGPKPFSDITQNLNFKIRAIDAPGTLQEFVVWEKRKSIIYRDNSGEIKGVFLNPQPGKPKDFPLSKFSQPLSRVVDSSERFLTSLTDRIWLFDSWNGSWAAITESPGATPLFWAERSGAQYLVSVAKKAASNGKQEVYQFFASRPGQFIKEPTCTYTQDAPFQMHMVKGSAAPNVYFYSVSETDRGRIMTMFGLNTLTCKFDKGTVYEGIRHPILGVNYLPNVNAIAVRLDHSAQNLLWWSTKGCDYFDVGKNDILVPNSSQAMLVSWRGEEGLEILYPDTAEKVKILQGLPLEDLQSNDVWLTNDLKHLYLSTRLVGENNRWLLDMDVTRN